MKWAWLVGTTPMPPMRAFGFQQSRYSYYPEAEVRRVAARLRSERIPADVIWLDIDFHTVVITDLHIADQPNIGYKPNDEGAAGEGARQISGMGSCGRFRLICSGFPEIFEASTEFRAAEGDDGVCALHGPVHAGAFEPGADHNFTARLHDAGRGA
jgi:hypothetical protein